MLNGRTSRANAHAPLHAADQCLLKEGREPRAVDGAVHDLLQLRPPPQDAPCNPSDGRRRVRQAVGGFRYRRTAGGVSRSRANADDIERTSARLSSTSVNNYMHMTTSVRNTEVAASGFVIVSDNDPINVVLSDEDEVARFVFIEIGEEIEADATKTADNALSFTLTDTNKIQLCIPDGIRRGSFKGRILRLNMSTERSGTAIIFIMYFHLGTL